MCAVQLLKQSDRGARDAAVAAFGQLKPAVRAAQGAGVVALLGHTDSGVRDAALAYGRWSPIGIGS